MNASGVNLYDRGPRVKIIRTDSHKMCARRRAKRVTPWFIASELHGPQQKHEGHEGHEGHEEEHEEGKRLKKTQKRILANAPEPSEGGTCSKDAAGLTARSAV
jgi:hypothetical protein